MCRLQENFLQIAATLLCPPFFVLLQLLPEMGTYVGALVTNLDHEDERHMLGMVEQGAGKSLGP